MKRELLLAAVLGLSSICSFAQGQFNVANSSSALVITNLGGVTGAAAASSINFKVQLYYQPDGVGSTAPAPIDIEGSTVSFGSWITMVGAPVITIFPTAGRFAGGTETTGTDVAPKGNVYLEMLGWSGGYTSMQGALDAGFPTLLFGFSTVWSQASGSGTPDTPANIAGFFPGLVLTPVPEPSMIALVSLGAAAILLHRRKKA